MWSVNAIFVFVVVNKSVMIVRKEGSVSMQRYSVTVLPISSRVYSSDPVGFPAESTRIGGEVMRWCRMAMGSRRTVVDVNSALSEFRLESYTAPSLLRIWAMSQSHRKPGVLSGASRNSNATGAVPSRSETSTE